jgi:hypothetical protein
MQGLTPQVTLISDALLSIRTDAHALGLLFHQKAANIALCLSLGGLELHDTKKDLENWRMEDDRLRFLCNKN